METIRKVVFLDLYPEEIDGQPIMGQREDEDGRTIVTVRGGKQYYWRDESYRVEPHLPTVPDGEWVEC